MTKSIYQFDCQTIDGEQQSLATYNDQVLLIVNTASACGFTPQYKGLESIYNRYKSQGFSVLAFPCNQFGKQEPKDDAAIQNFCDLTYQTSFPLFSKIKVNGELAHPLFQFLKTHAPGILGSTSIKWNFTKFLINRQGQVVNRFAPKDEPEALVKTIEALL